MIESADLTKYNKIFYTWKDSCPEQTSYLIDQVLQKICPVFQENGFCFSAKLLNNVRIGQNELLMERVVYKYIEYIYIVFDKYKSPKFQILSSKRSNNKEMRFLRSGNLVNSKIQYVHFWGKPYIIPMIFWRNSDSDKIIDKIIKISPQILEFLDSGVRGKNIGKEVGVNI